MESLSKRSSFIKGSYIKANNAFLRSKRNFSIYGILIFAIFLIFIVLSSYYIRNSFISNSNIAGNEIAQKTYYSSIKDIISAKEISRFVSYNISNIVNNKKLDPYTKEGETYIIRALQDGHAIFQTSLKSVFGISCYGSFSKKVIADLFYRSFNQTDVKFLDWYKRALTTKGEPVLSEPFINFKEKKVTFTISCTHDGINVFAIDFSIPLMSDMHYEDTTMGGFSYYIVSNKGKLITYDSDLNLDYKEASEFVNIIFEKNKKHQEKNVSLFPIKDFEDRQINYFIYQNSKTGWTCIVTLPYQNILAPFAKIVTILFTLVVLFLALEYYMIKREDKVRKAIIYKNEALKVLGNSYSLLIVVNYKRGTFKILKALDNMRQQLMQFHHYDSALHVIQQHVQEGEWERFFNSFCLESLSKISEHKNIDISLDVLMKSLTKPFNSFRWFNVSALYDMTKSQNEIILAFKDINDEKIRGLREHKLLKDSLIIAEKNEKIKSEFFSRISHDMRTPLNGITGLCILANKNKEDITKLNTYIGKISNSTKQLLVLINDLLDASKYEMEGDLVTVPFSITTCIGEVITLFKENINAQQKLISCEYSIKHDKVLGDKAKFSQIINNLVSNAIKYSGKGAIVKVNVTETLAFVKSQYTITIEDNGIGMSEEFLKNIFIPYAREDRASNVVGTGLGMVMVKNLVTKIGGGVKIRSQLNEGTTVTITVPFMLDREQEDQTKLFVSQNVVQDIVENTDVNIKADLDAESYENFSLKGLKVLLVEDNELNLDIASELLDLEGMIVTKAKNGKEAVEAFAASKEHYFDVVLMDMRMPIMNGCEASLAIRALPRADANSVKIIALTANAMAEDVAASREAKMDAYILKPIDFKILKKTLSSLVEKKEEC